LPCLACTAADVRDGIGVVEGRYRPDGIFNSTNLMVKHSNEYRPPKPGASPNEAARTLIKESRS
jgi:cytochrome c-type biogenesis protein CcmE